MNNITLKELAKKLGVSVSTVSKSLNDHFEISIETKNKVRALAEKLNYQPNILAKSLKTGRSNTIGVVIPYLGNPFQTQLLEGAHQAAHELNFKLVFRQTLEDVKKEKESLEILKQQNVDGVLITPSANTSLSYLKEFQQYCPLVLVDRIDFDIKTFKIGVNNEKGAYDATQHLINMGRKDIIILYGQNIGVSEKRLLGYKKALLANCINENQDFIIKLNYCQSKSELNEDLTKILVNHFEKYKSPIGLLGTTDTITITALEILSRLGISVPKQVAIIGFANTEVAEALNPSLSTVLQPAYEIGYKGVEKLVQLIKSKKNSHIEFDTTILDTIIIPRKSTRI